MTQTNKSKFTLKINKFTLLTLNILAQFLFLFIFPLQYFVFFCINGAISLFVIHFDTKGDALTKYLWWHIATYTGILLFILQFLGFLCKKIKRIIKVH